MAYQPPIFNLLANIWDCQFPDDGDADWLGVPCQKYIRSRMSLDTLPPDAGNWFRQWAPPIQLRFPRQHAAFTDIPATWDHVITEVPAGSGQFYRTRWQEIQHQGFPNEYAIILADACDSQGRALLPPGATLPTDVAPDVCESPPPPPAVEELQQGNFVLRDDGATGIVGIIARRQDETQYYEALYSPADNTFYIRLYPDSPFPNILASYNLVSPPTVGDFVFIQFWATGDSLSARIFTAAEDQTINATDSTYPTGIGGGIHIEYLHDVNAFNVYHDLVDVATDDFVDTAFTDLSVHSMVLGSGWFYGSTGSVFEIRADGISCGAAGTSAPTGFQIVMTDYPAP